MLYWIFQLLVTPGKDFSLEFLVWYHSFVFKWGKIGLCFSFLIDSNKKLISGYFGAEITSANNVVYIRRSQTLRHITAMSQFSNIPMPDFAPRKANLIDLGFWKGILKGTLVLLIFSKIWESLMFIVFSIVCLWM